MKFATLALLGLATAKVTVVINEKKLQRSMEN